jgi:hypothetical protein
MTKFRLVLVLLCLGSLGASAQQEAAAQGQTVRAQIGAPLNQALELARAGEYKKALAIIDGLAGIPNKTAYELSTIGQMRSYVTVRANGLADQQTR